MPEDGGGRCFLPPTNDFLFKKLWSDPRSAAAMLQAFAADEGETITADMLIRGDTNLLAALPNRTKLSCDVYWTTKTCHYMVEMQNWHQAKKGFGNRCMQYASRVFGSQAEEGKVDVRPVKLIAFSTINLTESKKPCTWHRITNQWTNKTDAMFADVSYRTVELTKFHNELSSGTEEDCYMDFFKSAQGLLKVPDRNLSYNVKRLYSKLALLSSMPDVKEKAALADHRREEHARNLKLGAVESFALASEVMGLAPGASFSLEELLYCLNSREQTRESMKTETLDDLFEC